MERMLSCPLNSECSKRPLKCSAACCSPPGSWSARFCRCLRWKVLRPDIPTDGAYLCLCTRRRAAARDHAVASTVRNAARHVQPKPDNRFVRWLTQTYANQLKLALKFRFVSLGLFAVVLAVTVLMLPLLGREFMPQLEEGNIYVRGTFPLNASLAEVYERTQVARETFKDYPEVESVVAQIGRPTMALIRRVFITSSFTSR